MCGCYTDRKNICRVHSLTAGQALHLDGLVGYMRMWGNTLTRDQASGCSELVGFVGKNEDDDENPVMVVELLVHTRRSPKMHYFADCVATEGRLRAIPYPPTYPLKVLIGDRTPRLGLHGAGAPRVACNSTTDELGMHMLSMKSNWALVPLQYTIGTSSPSLLHMTICGNGEEFVPSRRTTTRARKVNLPQELGPQLPQTLYHKKRTTRKRM